MSNQASVNLSWEENWKFTAADAYGHTVTVDAPMQDGDEFDGFKPTHLMMSALGACTGVDVVSILKKKRQDISGVGHTGDRHARGRVAQGMDGVQRPLHRPGPGRRLEGRSPGDRAV